MYGEKECVLYERVCIECGECDQCDINPEKICDNCMQCMQTDAEYLAIQIDGLLTNEEAIGEEGAES